MTTNFLFGLNLVSDPAAEIVGEEHCLAVDYQGVVSSGDGMVGGNFAVTPTGAAAAWVSGIYAKVTQGAVKAVNGYISGAEFEVINAADNVSDWFVLVLNSNNSGAQRGSHSSFIALRDYGSLELSSLLWLPAEITMGSDDDSVLLSSLGGDQASTHTIRITVDGTPYWILLSNAHG